jgi:hypothetical protein
VNDLAEGLRVVVDVSGMQLGNSCKQAVESFHGALRDDVCRVGCHLIQEQPRGARLVEFDPDVLESLFITLHDARNLRVQGKSPSRQLLAVALGN